MLSPLTPLCLAVSPCLTLAPTFKQGGERGANRKKKDCKYPPTTRKNGFFNYSNYNLQHLTFHGKVFQPLWLPLRWEAFPLFFGGGSQGTVIKPVARHEASPQELVTSCEIRATQAGTMSTLPYWLWDLPLTMSRTLQNRAEIVRQFNH